MNIEVGRDAGGNERRLSACSSRFKCSPCLYIWGTVLVVMLGQFLIRFLGG